MGAAASEKDTTITAAALSDLDAQPLTPKQLKAMVPMRTRLAKATEVFGSEERAEQWMAKPAMGLDGQRPIELLQTVQGAEIVNDFLTRLEYGVYT